MLPGPFPLQPAVYKSHTANSPSDNSLKQNTVKSVYAPFLNHIEEILKENGVDAFFLSE